MKDVHAEIKLERTRQEAKYGTQRHSYGPHKRLAVLVEEVGEVARAVNRAFIPPSPPRDKSLRANLREELIQMVAVAIAWVEAMDAESI